MSHHTATDKKSLNGFTQFCCALLAVVFLSACEFEVPVEESIAGVDKILEIRKQAIDNKDMDLYKSILLPEYSSSGVPLDNVIGDLERLFSTEEQIEFIYQKAPPSIAMNTARVIHMIEYKLTPSGKSKKMRETIHLRRVNGQWFISGGIILGLTL
ncbi:MAG: hypothetical protein COB33_001825 [Thiotrichaceae bacterium]|nr:hypothetical protein [Thiotrichaceae bacterium]PCI13580.1 MAG: hypothetical protein COB71_05380 [Thiotrichales bacterium]